MTQLPADLQQLIFLYLPINKLKQLCRESPRFSPCRSWYFWACRAQNDFGVSMQVFGPIQTGDPMDRYDDVEDHIHFMWENSGLM